MEFSLTNSLLTHTIKNRTMIKFRKSTVKKSPKYYIEGIRSNNPKIVKEIYKRFYSNIEKHICKNSGTSTEADDIFQDALIIMFKKSQQSTLQIQTEFGSYLFGVCKNLWLKKLQQNKKQSNLNKGIVFDDEDVNITEVEMIEHEKQKLYEEKFKLLKPSYQKILNLYFEGNSMSDIAQIMGFKSANYAQKRKHQCQEYLKQLIRTDKRYQELIE